MPQVALVLQQKLIPPSEKKKTLQIAHIVKKRCLTRFLTAKIMAEYWQLGVDMTNWLIG